MTVLKVFAKLDEMIAVEFFSSFFKTCLLIFEIRFLLLISF
jgi:hypothetical protein